MGVFGPRTIYCIALKDAPGCHEFLLQDDGKWFHVTETTEIGQLHQLPCLQDSPSACLLLCHACIHAHLLLMCVCLCS